jgi:LysM repeat protein
MKISKVFGFVLCLHLGVIAILIVQPGCGTTQPPSQTYQQNQTAGSATEYSVSTVPDGLIPATRIDPAFNAGYDASAEARSTPNRPAGDEFSEFNGVTPELEPVVAESAANVVNVEGPTFESYTIEKGDSLWAISKRFNTSLKELYATNGLDEKSVLTIGQQIQIPVEQSTATIKTEIADTYQPSGFNTASETYTVKGGDNLSKIAANYKTSVKAIKAANNKNSDMIRVGEQLVIPVGENLGSASASIPEAPASSAVTADTSGIHIVKAGEYPATIARQYDMSATELLAINGITDPRKMQIGQKLKVKASGSTANLTPIVEAAPAQPPVAAPVVTAVEEGPVEIRVVEATPLIEEEFIEVSNEDEMFENVVEIPVVRAEVE